MTLIIFLLGCSMVINVAVGVVAYLAILETQKCRHDTARTIAELIRVKPIQPVNPVTGQPFAVIVGRALANYNAEQQRRVA